MPHARLPQRVALLLAITLSLAPAAAVVAQVDSAEKRDFDFGYRLVQRGDFKAAVEAFNKYLAGYPNGKHRGDAIYYLAFITYRDAERATAQRLRDAQYKAALGFLSEAPAPEAVSPWKVQTLRALLHNGLRQYEQTIKALEPIKLDDLDAASKGDVLYQLGVAYRMTKNLKAAASHLTAAAQLDSPTQPSALLELAKVQAAAGEPKDAVDTLEQCLNLGNTDVAAVAAHLAGDLAYQAGDFGRAIEFYNVVLTRHQSSDEFKPVVISAMWAMLKARRFDALAKHFEQYNGKLEVKDRAAAWFLAGRAQQELGDHKQAASLFTAVAKANTGAAIEDQLLFRLAESQHALRQYEEMSQTIARLQREHPKSKYNADADYMLAKAEASQQNHTQAAAKFGAIIAKGEEHPYYAAALLDRAKLYQSTDDLAAAAKDYEAYLILAERPDTKLGGVSDTLVKLADVYYRLRKLDDAGRIIEKLLADEKLPPLVQQDSLYRKALILVQLRKLDEARAVFDQLLSLHPQTAYAGQVHYYRGVIFMTQQKIDHAVTELTESIKDKKLPTLQRSNALWLISVHQRKQDKADDAAKTLAELEKLITRDRMRVADMLWLARYYLDREPRTARLYTIPLTSKQREVSRRELAEAFYLEGQANRAVSNFDRALDNFTAAEAVGEGFGLLARLETARTQSKAGQRDKALKTYHGLTLAQDAKIAATALFEMAEIHRGLGDANANVSDTEGARNEYKEAYNRFYRLTVLFPHKELSPLPQLAHLHRAELAKSVGKPDDFAGSLKELRQRFDGQYAEYAKALELIVADQTAEAARILTRLRQDNPDPRLASRVHQRLKELESR